jgi:lipopolysaccharide export system protein LptA
MSISVERLRVWLLVGAGLLVLVIGAFLGYAHWRAHRFLTDLPKKLGVDIRRETNGFTYSQSVQGRTVYTIHAAKAVERQDGKMVLHDVGIVLYGREQNRADRIYGNEFEYDQKGGVIRAVGEVHIDLQAPEAADANAKMDYAAGKDLHGDEKAEQKDERLIHVKTSGLVYVQKLGVAATDNEIEFASGGMIGHAVGADYHSDTGVIVLRTAVRVNGVEHDRPVVLTASRAELDRQNERVILSQAKYMTVGGAGAAGETAEGQHVVVHLRKDGTAERLEAEGDVTLTNGESGKVVAPQGEMTLDENNKPLMAMMSGGLKYVADDPLRQAQGEAAEGKTSFDKAGKPEHAVMTGAVHLHERVRGSDAVPWDERELNAETVDLALSSDAAGKTFLRDAKASGSARLTVVSAVKGGVGTTTSGMSGDVLTAHFVRLGETDHISEVHGDGHASLRKVDVKGVVNTSTADSLVAHFHAVTAGAHDAGAKSSGPDEIADATEQGHVVMTQMPVRKPGDTAAPVPERASAERAVYDGALERTTLTGNVQVSDGTNVLWADRVVTEQQSGDATADGSVKASYVQAGSTEEPVHVLASRAEMKHDSQTAIFYGTAGKLARLWQGGSQVDAPVLQFEQKQKRLLAHGDGQGAPMAVHTVLVSNEDSANGGAGKKSVAGDGKVGIGSGKAGVGKIAGGGKTGVVRVASRELVYSDETRRADFTGGVEVESADGTMKGQQVVVYLQPAQAGATGVAAKTSGGDAKQSPSAAGGFMGGNVERIVASGHIDMQQPGRRATGEQLVYTASDGMFALTGTAKVPPKVVDAERGTVTGTLLRFHSGDENVVVSNGGDSADRVRTETRVKNKQ